MRIGVITILHVGNYGAEFQAHATVRFLKKLGFDAEIIDYFFYKNPRHRKTKRSAPLCVMPMEKRLKELLYPLIENVRWAMRGSSREQELECFNEFHRRHTPCSREYRTIDELYDLPMDYDACIVGSDQVWNPGICSSLLPYLLDFVPQGKKRLSFASSFGVTQIPEALKIYYAKAFRSMSGISVREESAAGLVKELSGCSAKVLADPTLLLSADEWAEAAEKIPTPERFILIYSVTPSPALVKSAERLAEDRGIPILRISISATAEQKNAKLRDLTSVSPGALLTLFRRAELVLTNSFHGTAFSLNFHKNFFCFMNSRKKGNDRQLNLLRTFGLENRIVWDYTKLPVSLPPLPEIAIERTLTRLRAEAVDFLRENLP